MKALTLLSICALAVSLSAQTVKKVPITGTSPASGEEMFNEYCAVCHGKDAKGDGPAAAALKKTPADLTSLTQRNDGKFPQNKVFGVIKGDSNVSAHGSRDMPMWGDLFSSLHPGKNSTAMAQMRISNLTDYVKSLQGK